MSQRGIIYFIASAETSRVKIGFTTGNPNARLKTLQTGSPTKLTLLAVRSGTMDDEQWLHREFADERLHGEWFDSSDRLVAFLGFVCWSACKEAVQQGEQEPKWARAGLDAIEEEFGNNPFDEEIGTIQ